MAQLADKPIFHRLVVGDDGSREGQDAAALASMIASSSGAEVSLLNVYPTALFPIRGMTDRQTFRRQAEKTLWAERRRWDLAATVATATDFSIPRALSHHAARWHADLIVVGSATGAEGGHARISPRCRQLLSGGRFSLAIARRGLAESGPRLRTVGVGYDGGPESKLALEVAAALARGSGGQLKVQTIVDNRLPLSTPAHWMTPRKENLGEAWEAERKEALRRAQQAVRACGKAVSVEAVLGDPAKRLRQLTQDVDLMVIGSRRWGPLARVLAGSVGEALVADAACSLLMVPRPSRADRRRSDSRRPQQSDVVVKGQGS